ncbi:hypothetical protein KVT40_000024 [Elsinoe batatas]|uniref:Uncharacterized protein n=1 Tax=Elsinoe batatas TaxID=2601811 RepID=A0A8K0PMC2_9PEZI|nr:hypothetical protein KVT40_000024 [Elsinoe batatas]
MAEPQPALSNDKAPLSIDTTSSTTRDDTPSTPSPMAGPPTPGGGPLSSHPATPVPTNDRFQPPQLPESDEPVSEPVKADSVTATTPLENTTPTKTPKSIPVTEAAAIASAATSRPSSSHLKTFSTTTTPIKSPIPRKPLTPASANASTKPQRRNSTGVRKLLSLTSLRSSFSSSRTSLNQASPEPKPIISHPSSGIPRPSPGLKRPSSPSVSSTLSPTPSTGAWQTYTASVSGGNTPAPSPGNENSSPGLRKRKSGNWFRRASVMWGNEELEKVPEAKENYTTKSGSAGSQGKDRDPRSPGVPVLPEIKALDSPREGQTWGDGMFAGIGR